jgi:hypothetical protein
MHFFIHILANWVKLKNKIGKRPSADQMVPATGFALDPKEQG